MPVEPHIKLSAAQAQNRTGIALALLLIAIIVWPGLTAAQSASPTAAAPVASYRISAEFHPAIGLSPATITGTEDLRFYNETGQSLPALYFRLYANAPEYAEGGITVSNLTINGASNATMVSVDDTVLSVPLTQALAAGQSMSLRLTFTTTIPVDPQQSYGMFGYNPTSQTWALAHWYPVLAGWDPVSGWNLALWSPWGDAIFTTTSRYDVTLTVPSSLVVAATGHLQAETAQDSTTTRHYTAVPVRDFAIVIGATLRTAEASVGHTVITSYFLPDDARGGAWALTSAAQSLAVYNRLFGTYPFADLAVVEVPLRNAAGVEFPQLVMIDAGGYRSNPGHNPIPEQLDFTVGHEVAHQWWFSLVGNDQYQHAFLDESLTNYSTVMYFEQQYGEADADRMVDINLKLPYFNLLFTAGDEVVDQPTNAFRGDVDYVPIIYGKGPLGFAAIRTAIGDDAYLAGLRLYLQREQGNVATPQDLLRAFADASGRNLDGLWHHWFDQADGKQDYTRQDFTDLTQELGK